MDNRSLFDKTIRYQDQITFFDLFTGIKEKHTKQDRENTLLAGTSIDTASNESAMLQKWKAPWLFLQVLVGGLLFSLILILCAAMTKNLAVNLLFLMFASCVVPVAMMIFFWELNVPRNISVFQLIVCFVTGGLFSIVASLVLGNIMNVWTYAFLAPIAEEPGKLIISLVILKWISNKKDFKIYGMTGLIIGAAVGAGFAAFETAQYAFTYGVVTLTMRSIFMLASHVMFCALYMTVAALLMSNGAFDLGFLKQKNFWIIFLFSGVIHAAWNFSASYLGNLIWIVFVIVLFLEWKLMMKLIRECFRQIAQNVSTVNETSVLATDLKLKCIQGVHSGRVFALKRNSILVGTDSSCNLVYPLGTFGISNVQCKMVVQNGGLYLADAGSKYGTYLNGTKLKPLKGQLLKKGDVFWLGSESEKYIVE